MNEQTPTTPIRVLMVDDDPTHLRAAAEILRREGCDVVALDDAVEALAASSDPKLDVAVLDIKMPNISGMDLLKALRRTRPDLEVVMMTAWATVETAVQAVKAGAYDYLTKPFESIDVLSMTVKRAAEKKRLRDRTRTLEAMLTNHGHYHELIGQSPVMQRLFRQMESVSQASSTVLVLGESGTGKEKVARALHHQSPRRDKPFLSVNCSALTETLLETELFGHVKGAFTGATNARKGLFESADGGTLFLDEIGDISPATQVRLLRVLQEGEIRRVGSNEPLKIDVRVIAATNVDLARASSLGRFRKDLFYRLNVISLTVPPLRERTEDIPLLAQAFLTRAAARAGKKVPAFTPAALEAIAQAGWAGNVRELENAIEGAVVMSQNEQLDLEDLPAQVREGKGSAETELFNLAHLPYAQAKRVAMRSFERRYLATLLEKSNNNVSSAARAAGVDRSNFRRLLKQYEVGGRSRKAREAAALRSGVGA